MREARPEERRRNHETPQKVRQGQDGKIDFSHYDRSNTCQGQPDGWICNVNASDRHFNVGLRSSGESCVKGEHNACDNPGCCFSVKILSDSFGATGWACLGCDRYHVGVPAILSCNSQYCGSRSEAQVAYVV